MIKTAQLNRRKWRLVCAADWNDDGQLMAKVAPEEVPADDRFDFGGTRTFLSARV